MLTTFELCIIGTCGSLCSELVGWIFQDALESLPFVIRFVLKVLASVFGLPTGYALIWLWRMATGQKTDDFQVQTSETTRYQAKDTPTSIKEKLPNSSSETDGESAAV